MKKFYNLGAWCYFPLKDYSYKEKSGMKFGMTKLCREASRMSQELFPFVKMVEILGSIVTHLSFLSCDVSH